MIRAASCFPVTRLLTDDMGSNPRADNVSCCQGNGGEAWGLETRNLELEVIFLPTAGHKQRPLKVAGGKILGGDSADQGCCGSGSEAPARC